MYEVTANLCNSKFKVIESGIVNCCKPLFTTEEISHLNMIKLSAHILRFPYGTQRSRACH